MPRDPEELVFIAVEAELAQAWAEIARLAKCWAKEKDAESWVTKCLNGSEQDLHAAMARLAPIVERAQFYNLNTRT